MNRQVVVDAIDAAGNLGQQGHRLTYDANGNRTSDTYYGNQVVVAGGQRVLLGFEEDGTAVYDTTPVTYTRQQGMVTETYRYDAEDRIVSVVRDGVQIDHRNYDGAGRVTMTGPNGALPQGYAQKLNEGVEQGQTNGLETRINRYDQNGRLVHQRTLKSDNAAKTDIDYTAYDAAGNVLQYRMTDHEGGYTNTYNYTFARYDGYKEDTISGTSTKLNPGSTKSDYDVNGNLIRVTDSTKPENNRTFVNDANGHVLLVNQGGNVERELVVNGEVLGQHGVGVDKVTPRNSQGNPNFAQIADFEFGYQSIVSNYPNAAPGSYTVQSGDTLRSIARSAYGDSALWYQIADANGLASDSGLRVGQTLNIPNKAAGVHNDGGVFKPYDPSKIVGDTTPNLPTPASNGGSGCGMLGQVIMTIVAIVVTVVVAIYAPPAAGPLGNALIGAAAATAGAVSSQAVGMAIGAQKGFDFKAVALAAVGGAVTGGLSGLSVTGGVITDAVIRGALSSVITQGIGVATGLQKSFSWTSVAATAVGSGVGAGVSVGISQEFGQAMAVSPSGRAIAGALGSLAAGAMRGGSISMANVALDAFGNALGSSLANANSSGGGMTAQEQTLAQSQGNVMSFGGVYGNADGPSYLSNTPTTGMFDGLAVAQNTPVPVLLASNGGIVSDVMPSPDAEALRRATNGFDPEFPHVGPREENGQMPQITVGAKALPVNGGFGQSVTYDQFGQPLNGPSNYDAGTQLGKIWGSSDSLGAKLDQTWDWANYTVPDAKQRAGQLQPQLSTGAATLNNMLGSPMAAIGAGVGYALGWSQESIYAASQTGAALEGVAGGFAGFQMPKAPQPGQATAASRGRSSGNVAGETTATSTGKSVHTQLAAERRASADFDLVNQPLADASGSSIQVTRRVDLQNGQPLPISGYQVARPDAVRFDRGVIIDDKPLGRAVSKDQQEIIRFIRAYQESQGSLPRTIAIQRYDPVTGRPVVTDLYKPSDFLPGGGK